MTVFYAYVKHKLVFTIKYKAFKPVPTAQRSVQVLGFNYVEVLSTATVILSCPPRDRAKSTK